MPTTSIPKKTENLTKGHGFLLKFQWIAPTFKYVQGQWSPTKYQMYAHCEKRSCRLNALHRVQHQIFLQKMYNSFCEDADAGLEIDGVLSHLAFGGQSGQWEIPDVLKTLAVQFKWLSWISQDFSFFWSSLRYIEDVASIIDTLVFVRFLEQFFFFFHL